MSGGQTSTTSATSSAAAAAARGDRSNSNPNGRAAGSNDNRAGRSTPPQEGDALENSNCDTTANQPSIDAADKNEDDEVRCIPAAPSVGQATNGNACIHAESAAGRSTSADASLEAQHCISASNNGRADKPVVITHQTISRLSSNENSDVEPNLDYNEEEAKQTSFLSSIRCGRRAGRPPPLIPGVQHKQNLTCSRRLYISYY